MVSEYSEARSFNTTTQYMQNLTNFDHQNPESLIENDRLEHHLAAGWITFGTDVQHRTAFDDGHFEDYDDVDFSDEDPDDDMGYWYSCGDGDHDDDLR
jgi:hypothetical protein